MEEGVGANLVLQVRKRDDSDENGLPVTLFDLDSADENVKFNLSITSVLGTKNGEIYTGKDFKSAFELLSSGTITQSLNFVEVKLTQSDFINFNEIDKLDFTFTTCDEKVLEEPRGATQCNNFNAEISITEKNKAPTSSESGFSGRLFRVTVHFLEL